MCRTLIKYDSSTSCRNVFPDNLFQASIQQAHTVYLPKPGMLQQNISSRSSISGGLNKTLNDTANALVRTGAEALRLQQAEEQAEMEPEMVMVRDVQYRNGTNTLGIVFFCLVFGTFLGTIGQKGQVVVDFFAAIFEVIMKMVTCVMWLTPVGISSVIAGKILSVDNLSLVMAQLVWFIITVAIGVLIYQWLVMPGIYFVFVRRNPYKFYAGLIQPMLTAFATAST